MRPKRVQLSRKRGWRKPPNTVVVSRPSKWGNPFLMRSALEHQFATKDNVRQVCVDFYRDWLNKGSTMWSTWMYLDEGFRERVVAEAPKELRGKNLACWCPLPKDGQPDLCHAAVLLEIANSCE